VTEPATVDALPPGAIAALLAATIATIDAEMAGLGTQGGWRPAPSEWSANECIGHLLEAERRGFAGRIRIILEAAAARPDLPPDLEDWDPPSVAEARQDHRRDGRELAAEFATLRREGVALVRSLTPGDMGRIGVHPVIGPVSVDELLGEWVHHDRNHVRQLLAVTQARAWEQMGATRRFSLDER